MTARRLAIGMTALLLTGAAPPPAERIVTGDGVVAATINGVPARIRVDPGAPGIPLITPELAARAEMKGRGMLAIGLGYSVGPEVASHRTEVARIDAGSGEFKRRIGWGSRPYAPIADGTIGPIDLPEQVIRFVLRPAVAGERTMTLPMVDGGGMFGGFAGLYAEIIVGGQPMRVRFDPHHPRTLANAGAALRLANAQNGRLSGDTAPVEIAFGIERPVRTMTLARPLAVGPLSIATLGARTTDGGNATGIAEGPPPAVDPEEIVVVAKGKKRDPNRDRLSIGADLLDRCSSLVFDKPAKQIRLTCA